MILNFFNFYYNYYSIICYPAIAKEFLTIKIWGYKKTIETILLLLFPI